MLTSPVLCLFTEEELKRLNEALADDNSYSAVSFDYDSSNKTAEESSAAEISQGLFEFFRQRLKLEPLPDT